MTVHLTNTLTRRKEPLVPLVPGEVTLYTCGPTVHDRAHIGNFRTFVTYDLLRRTLARAGLRVRHVMNITDVEDKIIRKAQAAQVPIAEWTARYVEEFHRDRRSLRILDAELYPLATGHVPDMVALIAELERRGHTYRSEGSVYFRIASFPPYGRLSGLDAAGLRAGARIDADEYEKEQVQDFVLWKAARPGEPSWETPFGPGRPGWHIECSAMAMRYLGRTLDLHTGGVDLIFPHHENEIAQSEAATGEPFARVWLHAEHLQVEGDKMAKSKGNFLTLEDLRAQGVEPRALRYAYLGSHYRKQVNFTSDSLAQAAAALARLDNTLLRLETEARPAAAPGALVEPLERARRGVSAALADDLNSPEALAALHGLLTELNTRLDQGGIGPGEALEARAALHELDQALALLPEAAGEAPPELLEVVRRREEARRGRDWAEADRLRERALALGWLLEDVKGGGTRWKRA